MFSLKNELSIYLSMISDSADARQILSDSVEACSKTGSPVEFEFLINKYDFFTDFNKKVTEHINKESDKKSKNDIYRSELWRNAVISATESKHNSPMLYADKVLAHYDDKFNIK